MSRVYISYTKTARHMPITNKAHCEQAVCILALVNNNNVLTGGWKFNDYKVTTDYNFAYGTFSNSKQ